MKLLTKILQEEKINRVKNNVHLLIPLGLALYLRWADIGKSSIWYDEALTINLTRQPVFEMVRLLTNELNPPLWEIIAWFMVQILPPNEYSYRLVSFLSAIGIWILAQKILSYHQTGKLHQFLTLSLLAVLPYQIWMAQDARVYALMSYLYLLGYWFVIHRKWLGLFACCGLLLYSNSAALFYVASLLIIGVFYHPQNRVKTVVIGTGGVLIFSPWIFGSFLSNLSGQYFSGYGIPPVNAQRIIEQVSNIFMIGGNNLPLIFDVARVMSILTILVLMGGFVIKKILERKSISISIPLLSVSLLAVVPLVLITLVAWIYNNGHLILYRSFSGISAPLILLIAVHFSSVKNFSTIILTVFFVIYSATYLFWSPQTKGGYLKEKITLYPIENHSSTVIFHATATSLLPFDYYLDGASHYLLDAELPAWFLIEPLQQAFRIQKITPHQIPSDSYWVVWARDNHLPPQVHDEMAALVKTAQPLGVIDYPQAARIEIYKISRDKEMP
ncbi:MAG: hypothetical protein ROW48_04245 [Bellilinea sp.]|jgi:hypothetical protein